MSRPIRIAINGFGRIGRAFFRLAQQHDDIHIVRVNDIAHVKTLAHLLKYDSVHGPYHSPITINADSIVVHNKETTFTRNSSLNDINWSTEKVDIVIESSGQFKTRNQLQHHIINGAKKVILSVPSIDDSVEMLILGVNDSRFNFNQSIISLASCTTNNAAPMLDLIDKHYTVKKAYISTIHSYTSDQNLHDRPHKDLRRARAATQSIIPTTTGAAKALTKVFPHLSEVIGGCGIRVPVPNGSLTDMTLVVEKATTTKEVNAVFKAQVNNQTFPYILKYEEDPIVSKDIVGSPYSCVFDQEMTSVIGKDLIKLIGWYDNETGYSNRILDVITQTPFIKIEA